MTEADEAIGVVHKFLIFGVFRLFFCTGYCIFFFISTRILFDPLSQVHPLNLSRFILISLTRD